jgi:caffeoyl-CoA O-methyltransferase
MCVTVRMARRGCSASARFLALLAANTPAGQMVEVGTSAGYSSLWIGLACEQLGRRLTTFEILPEKITLAQETFKVTQMESTIHLVAGDARDHLPSMDGIAFCFVDAEKDVYADCYEALIPRLVPGGLLVADNAISHWETLQPLLDRALADKRVDALIVPIGKGELVCRRL